MAHFEVWHADPPNFMGDTRVAEKFPDGYRKVADVAAGTPSEVFRLTNHIDLSWERNPGVRATPGSHRSTSVGDVVVCGTLRYMVAWIGFTPLLER